MKLPASWSSQGNKNPTNWQGSSKNVANWDTTDKPKLADVWSATNPKIPVNWDSGQWLYDSFLPYDTYVSYNGFPKPVNTKIPSAWVYI